MLNAPLPFQPLKLDFQTLELDFQPLNLDNLVRVHDTMPHPQRFDMSTLLCLLFYDASSDNACVFLCVSMHLEAVCPHKKKYQRNVEWQRKSG